ncbi:MAG: lipopolysaccharide heptosyltransferase I [Syntrophotalea acetylenica]|nr:lipopolysaccharide heptosyltransferase I [Syntrophotalea acetylenica]
MRVLIVKISALGDVVHALPVLTHIKSAYPETSIDWLVEEAFAPLLDGHPALRRIHRLGLKRWRRQGPGAVWAGVMDTLKELRSERYDLVLDLQGNCKSGLFTLLCGAPRRYGFSSSGVREWPNLLATNHKVQLTAADHHVSDRSLALARAAFPLGTGRSLAGPMSVSPAARTAVEKQLCALGLNGQSLVGLQYGTTWQTKLWPLDSWQGLALRMCREDQLRPVLIWGNDEEHRAAEAISRATDGRALVWPRGSLQELAALLERADLVVGGDTGPIHIAAALETPTVSIFRVTDASRNGPRGPLHIRLQSPLECSPCLRKDCPRDSECGHSIGVDQVLEASRALLSRCSM